MSMITENLCANDTWVPLPLPGGPNKTALIPLNGISSFSFDITSVCGGIFITVSDQQDEMKICVLLCEPSCSSIATKVTITRITQLQVPWIIIVCDKPWIPSEARYGALMLTCSVSVYVCVMYVTYVMHTYANQ